MGKKILTFFLESGGVMGVMGGLGRLGGLGENIFLLRGQLLTICTLVIFRLSSSLPISFLYRM